MSILNRISDDFHNKKAANAINNLQVLHEVLSTFTKPIKALIKDIAGTPQKDTSDNASFVTLSAGTPEEPASIDIIIETLKELYYILDQDDETREQVGTVLKALKILGFQSGI